MPNFKEAAIESPSEQEKKHINDEEQGIDVPVVDNKCIKKHNKNCCKEANIMYDEMVKRAYEEILEDDLGYDYDYNYDEYDKEAGVKDIAGKAWGGIKSAPGKAWRGMKSYGRTVSGKGVEVAKNQLNNLRDEYSHIYGGNENKIKEMMGSDFAKGVAEKMPHDIRKARIARGAAIAVPALAAAGATAYGVHRHNKAKSQAEQEAAEKAAAYYDEAQYVKEAAEADYAEACAYEDAAIQILDELGYLD